MLRALFVWRGRRSSRSCKRGA